MAIWLMQLISNSVETCGNMHSFLLEHMFCLRCINPRLYFGCSENWDFHLILELCSSRPSIKCSFLKSSFLSYREIIYWLNIYPKGFFNINFYFLKWYYLPTWRLPAFDFIFWFIIRFTLFTTTFISAFFHIRIWSRSRNRSWSRHLPIFTIQVKITEKKIFHYIFSICSKNNNQSISVLSFTKRTLLPTIFWSNIELAEKLL